MPAGIPEPRGFYVSVAVIAPLAGRVSRRQRTSRAAELT